MPSRQLRGGRSWRLTGGSGDKGPGLHLEIGARVEKTEQLVRAVAIDSGVHFGMPPNYAARGRGGEGGGEEKDSERSGRAEGRVVGELGNRGNWV